MSDDVVSTREACDWLGIGPEALNALAHRGVVPKVGKGQWRLRDVVRSYCEHAREMAAGRKSDVGDLDLVQERAALAKAQREAQDMKNDTMRGELLPKAEVDAAVMGAFARVRAVLLKIPGRIATAGAGKPRHEILPVAERFVGDALEELSMPGNAGFSGKEVVDDAA